MTALKPIESRRVVGVKSGRYPLNETCAHPECREKTADGHHAFPRSLIGNSLWFVEIQENDEEPKVIPHVTGLCRAHHDDVEQHRAWIKLEDGEFRWYDRLYAQGESENFEWAEREWELLGPLNPQPGSREGKPKRRKFQGEARRKRKVISLRVPVDAEDLAGQYEDKLERVEALIGMDEKRSPIYTIVSALDYVLLNEGTPVD